MSTPSTVLVTGAGGFLGRHTVAHLLRSSTRRVVAVHRQLDPGPGQSAPNLEQLEADLATREGWLKLPDQVDALVHLAAALPGPDEERYRVNSAMADHLVERAGGWTDLRRVVHSSSILAYGQQPGALDESLQPRNPDAYGASKLAAEEALDTLDCPVASLRLSSIYGPGQGRTSVLPLFIERARRGEILELYGDGRRMQDFVYVRDVVTAVELALDSTASGVFNVGSGSPTSMQSLAMNVLDLFGTPGARIEHAWKRVDEAPSVTLNVGRARRELGYDPAYDLRAGLEDYRRAAAVTEPAP